MEYIKKTILQAVTTGTTTGCTGTCRVIIPDLTKVYYFKIGLVQEAHDWGFFDTSLVPYYGYGYSGYGEDEEDAYGMGEPLLMDDLYI